jgi:3-hydroxyisobutyrate dehydrogenase
VTAHVVPARRVGFLGLGTMGEPMAANLARAGTDLVVWNRSPDKVRRLAELGATPATGPEDLVAQCDTVLVMLADAGVVDAVLGRAGGRFAVPVAGRTVVHMGTVSPPYSRGLGQDLGAAGAAYVEAPVSGSRIPAERGELVAMLAGVSADLDRIEPLLGPVCSAVFRCGAVPGALQLKLAVNAFLISLVVGLAESVRFAETLGLDLALLRAVIDAGPMSSPVSQVKLAKLVTGDHAAQASVRDVRYNSRLILDEAAAAGSATPLLTVCEALLGEAEGQGLGNADMVAVLEAIRAREEER